MMISLQKIVNTFDIFQRQFIFYVGNSKAKQTIIGGFLSLFVISISIIYLVYLLNLFFENQIEPKISINQYIDAEYRELIFDEEFLMFEMIISGEPLHLLEKRTQKKYLSISLKYEEWDYDNTKKEQTIELVECQDQNFSKYLCADQKQVKPLITYNLKAISKTYSIYIGPCTGLPQCASEKEIIDFIFLASNYFHVAIKTKQYNKETFSFQNQVFTEYMYFDYTLFLYSNLQLILGETSIKTGNIIQSTKKTKTAYEYKRNDIIQTQEKLEQKFGVTGYACIQLGLDQKSVNISIQYPMITEVFAQFTSVLNTLFIIGFISRAVAQAGIINDLMEILLKDYYKQTTIKLLNINDNMLTQRLKKNLDSKLRKQQLKQQIQDHQEQILNINQKINQISITKDEMRFFNIDITQKIKSFMNKVFRTKFRVAKSNAIESKLYEKILQEALQKINVYSIYSDLLKLKMAIKLIFTKEQFAAFQYCGSEFSEENQYKKENIEVNQVQQVINANKTNRQQTKDVIQDDKTISSNIENLLSNNALIPSSFQPIKDRKNNETINMDIQQPTPNLQSEDKNNEKQIQFKSLQLTARPFDDYEKSISNCKQSIKNSMIIDKLKGDQEVLDLRSSQEIQIIPEMIEEKEKAQQNEKKKQEESDIIGIYQSQYQFSQMVKNKCERNCQEISEKKQKQYLFEMDQIESIPQIREQYLKRFIQNFRNNQTSISSIDFNLFNNLINVQSLQVNNI